MHITTRKLAAAAVTGAAYAALTMLLAPISYGAIQCRVSEVLCILPFFIPCTAWGLFAGCAIANLLSAAGIFDVVFGSLATLLAALSRSGLLAFAGVMVILVSAIIAGTAKHPARLLALVAAFIVLCGAAGVKITKDKMYEAAVEDYNLAVYNHETYGNPITVPKPEDRTISMDDLTSDRWGIWTTILENLTWNGHQDSVIWEWVAKDGAGDRHYNAHNAFFGVTYNNGFIAGLLLVAYTALAFIRALRYYWAHRKESPYAATPLAFCTVFILVGMFESVYAPFSVIGCAYFLVQAPLWRAE